MRKPRLLDLFCGAGGCSVGYARAGFEVILGVDILPQRNYPFTFYHGDVMSPGLIADLADAFNVDLIHASPPCQEYTQSTLGWRNKGKVYPDLVGQTRKCLKATSLPWVIENVPNAPIRADYFLCGSQFGLKLVRHRLFEVSWGPLSDVELMPPCSHDHKAITVTGKGTPSYVRNSRKRYGIVRNSTYSQWCKEAMGIDWMSRHELSQAIPPAYTEFIGRQAWIKVKSLHGALEQT